MVETKIFEIMDEAKELEAKIAQYKDVADQEMVIVWMDNILKLLMKLGKLAEETEDRVDELKESVEKG
jgi:dimeric dUTPase (all-alpha-NTP-PPase superfamily)